MLLVYSVKKALNYPFCLLIMSMGSGIALLVDKLRIIHANA